ncbi:MAG: DUF2169 domain-containing protein, partial [Deltaproteobacteria bacterium]|nr:DUF2169 domain-containing protein [Deltaproteobacteria bacterium]
EIVLENLVAGQPCLRTRLPGLRPVAVLQRQEGGRETPELVADTLFIDADQGMCTLTWRAQAPLWHLAEEGRIEVALEGERGEIHGGPVRAALAPRPSAPELWDEPSTDDPDGEVTEPTCPTLELPPARARARSAPPREELTPVATPLPGAVPREPLPFRRSEPPSRASAPGAPRPSAPSWDEEIALPEPPAPPDAGSTLDERLAPPARPSEPLPFRQPAPRAPVESTLDESELPPAVPSRPLPFGAPAPAAAAPLPPPPVPRLPAAAAPGPVPSRPGKAMSPWAAAARASGRVSSADRAGAASESAGAAELAGGGPPQPPPMIGPLATPEMVEREQAAATPAQVEAPAAPPGAEPDAGAPAPAGEPAAVVDLLSAEQCGAIAASLARRPDEAADILKESKLGPEAWKTIEAHWAEQIRDETGRGKARLLRAYDTAYVARLEEERGTIEVEQYARLVVAAERGQAAEVLRELSLPSGALVRIERVFLRRLVERPGLGERVRKAVEAARER